MSNSGDPPPPPVLLHGDVDLTIHEARGLPNMDFLSTLLRRLCLRPSSAPAPARSVPGDGDDRHQPHGHHILPTSDPYAAVVVAVAGGGNITVARTHVVRNSEDPTWSTRVLLHLAHVSPGLSFHVKDADPFGSDLIGVALLPSSLLLSPNPIISQWLPLLRPDGRGRPKPNSAIRISASFFPAADHRIAGGGGIPIPAYFPARRGCEVRLYQDAHVAGGGETAARCWEEMCMAILGAQHLVYVVGWSVNTRVRMLREERSPEMERKLEELRELAGGGDGGKAVEEMTLGELLKYKSQEGVRVCLLVWDDKTSHDNFFLKTGGVMQTGDEETKKFFKHSSVICVLSPRYPSSKLSMAKQKMVGTLYTHHQKCVLVDTPASETTRRITAFLGGLDLAAGRYDTPSHRLFDDLHTVFSGDVYNPSLSTEAAAGGPRQPWHDMHCRVDGPAAYDVLENFEQRWRKATRVKRHWKDDSLLKLDRISWILSPSAAGAGEEDDRHLYALPEGDPECWHTQVFRSVDSGSVKGFPRCWQTKKMEQHNLLCDRNLAVEQSIHTAYVRAIRSAQRFIYIENQYFIGSSYAWPSYKHPGAGNLVPMEIALKVASKIAAGERFAVYIVIPMWPEGNPNSGPVQEILFWQRQTMQTMYEVIAAAIRDSPAIAAGAAYPQDYLNFYCLGKREAAATATRSPDGGGAASSAAALARWHRRFMIYVHSKGMIVDDDYVIIGSANINQRSLAGSRDTEIAVGAYQPHHRHRHRRGGGKVYGYRLSLWEEHLGDGVGRWPEMSSPESKACVDRVNEIADENWRRYTDDERVVELEGHLMRYPVAVDRDGKVSALTGHEMFPDVGGRIVGSTNNYLDYLTM